MNIKHQSLTIDLNKTNILPNIVAHQGDQKTRFIDVTLTMSGEEIMLNDNYRAIVKASNNGEVKAINDCQIDLERNVITVELTSTMLDTAGFLNCEITIVDGDNYITSQNFIVEVAISTIGEDEEIKISKEYGTLIKLIEEVTKIENDAKVVKDIISHLAEIKDIDELVNSKADKEDVANKLATKENISDKINQIIFPSTTYYPSTKAVWDFVIDKLSKPISNIENLKKRQLNLAIKNTTDKSTNVTVNDSSNCNILGLTLYGKSTESTVPSPDSPVEIDSVENPDITLADEKNSQNLQINCILRGINSICDELTVNSDGTGYITQNLFYERLSSGKSYSNQPWKYSTSSERFYRDDSRIKANYNTPYLLCTHFPAKDNEKDKSLDNTIGFTSGGGFGVAIRMSRLNGDISAFENWLDSNEVYVLLPLRKPIVTTLSQEEVEKILSLHTYYPSTTIKSDCDSQLTYISDTKNYIDNK